LANNQNIYFKVFICSVVFVIFRYFFYIVIKIFTGFVYKVFISFIKRFNLEIYLYKTFYRYLKLDRLFKQDNIELKIKFKNNILKVKYAGIPKDQAIAWYNAYDSLLSADAVYKKDKSLINSRRLYRCIIKFEKINDIITNTI